MNKEIVILGAGLAGSLLGVLLAKKGRQVSIFEKRPDVRSGKMEEGRSINLALSHRGLQALEKAGVASQVKEIVIPMRGRMMHSTGGELTFQPYGQEGQFINSISRADLNRLLIEHAAAHQVDLHFNHWCEDVDLRQNTAYIRTSGTNEILKVKADLLVGADGAFSALRGAMQKTPRFNYSQHYIEHGYKELTIPPTMSGDFAMEPHALHIWPRGGYMLIALPNQDRSFTCTLFLAYEGKHAFANLQSADQVLDFFEKNFPNIIPLMPQLIEEFFENPTSDLVTIQCYPWSRYSNNILLGDAAHAIVPFYGQGMNAAFEDCHIFSHMMEAYPNNLPSLIETFQQVRKPDADAIAELALRNFMEMRDLVADPVFLERKKIEAELHKRYPNQWIPLYTMVTFTNMRYSEALKIGDQQDHIMQKVMKRFSSVSQMKEEDFGRIIGMLTV